MRLILASTSPFRQAMLRQAGLDFVAVAPSFEEFMLPDAQPDTLALLLAEGKADSIADRFPNDIILAADQVGECEGVLLGKPADAQAAYVQLERQAGRTHRLISGVVLIGPEPGEGGGRPTLRLVEETRLTFRSLTAQELHAYVATGEWQGCAGAYRLEGQGVQLIERIEGDFFNIIGLPMLSVLEGLRRLGFNPLLR
ncbi:MAG: Maf family protein [Myxococcota bacterium]